MSDTKKGNFKNRSKARILCVEAIYQYSYGQISKEQLLILKWIRTANPPNEETQSYYSFLLNGILSHLEEIDQVIGKFTMKNDVSMMRIDQSILRFAVFSLLYNKNIPAPIIINEAIKIAKMYSGVNAHYFINGILDKISKNIT